MCFISHTQCYVFTWRHPFLSRMFVSVTVILFFLSTEVWLDLLRVPLPYPSACVVCVITTDLSGMDSSRGYSVEYSIYAHKKVAGDWWKGRHTHTHTRAHTHHLFWTLMHVLTSLLMSKILHGITCESTRSEPFVYMQDKTVCVYGCVYLIVTGNKEWINVNRSVFNTFSNTFPHLYSVYRKEKVCYTIRVHFAFCSKNTVLPAEMNSNWVLNN